MLSPLAPHDDRSLDSCWILGLMAAPALDPAVGIAAGGVLEPTPVSLATAPRTACARASVACGWPHVAVPAAIRVDSDEIPVSSCESSVLTSVAPPEMPDCDMTGFQPALPVVLSRLSVACTRV